MERPRSRDAASERLATQAGSTLVEILIAIFIMGVGLLASLTLFTQGAIDMAEAVTDDRSAAIAEEASALGQAGEALVSRTANFVQLSLSTGSVDTVAATRLREEYEQLALQAAAMELRLDELMTVFPSPVIQRRVPPLSALIRAIEHWIGAIARLLSLLETWRPARQDEANLPAVCIGQGGTS